MKPFDIHRSTVVPHPYRSIIGVQISWEMDEYFGGVSILGIRDELLERLVGG